MYVKYILVWVSAINATEFDTEEHGKNFTSETAQKDVLSTETSSDFTRRDSDDRWSKTIIFYREHFQCVLLSIDRISK